jgi:two-component system chemotaxis sensor kinase CheA
VQDDGGGLKRDKILAKAIERGLVDAGHHLSDEEVYALIFEPGFSTAEKVTNLSGRGVGMDVVKRNITALRGTVGMTSEEGVGTLVTMRCHSRWPSSTAFWWGWTRPPVCDSAGHD